MRTIRKCSCIVTKKPKACSTDLYKVEVTYKDRKRRKHTETFLTGDAHLQVGDKYILRTLLTDSGTVRIIEREFPF